MKSWSVLLVVFLSLLLVGCEFTLAADVTPPPGYRAPVDAPTSVAISSGQLFPLLPPNPTEGKPIYEEKCAPCHGAAGLGDGPQAGQLPNPVTPLGATDTGRQALPSEWFRIVSQGNLDRFMPPFNSLTTRQRWDVVAYSLSLSATPASLAVAAEDFRTNCAECHAPDGKGEKPGVPDFSNQERMAEKSVADFYEVITNGAGELMPGYAENLSTEKRWGLAAYVRTFSFASSVVASADAAVTTPTPLTTPDTSEGPAEDSAETPGEPGEEQEEEEEMSGFGSVTGLVSDASGILKPEGITVTLHGFDHMTEIMTITTTTEAGGAFMFEKVEMPEGRFFLTTTEYEGVTYGSDVIAAQPDLSIMDLPIQIYETTSDSSVLVVDRLHFFFEKMSDDLMRVVELYVISNTSDKTLKAAQPGQPVISFTLPADAANLEFQDGVLGGRYVATANGFGDTMPVRPGSGVYQLMFTYELPYSRKLELVRQTSMATNALVILVPEDGLKISGPGIQDAGVRNVEGIDYHMYNGSGFAMGDEMRLSISSSVRLFTGDTTTGVLVGVAALGLVLIAAGVFMFRRNQAQLDETIDELEDSEPEPAPVETPEAAMDAILALDDLFQAGQLPEEAYRQRRAELKEQLAQLLAGEQAEE